jgi:hypothetical protein
MKSERKSYVKLIRAALADVVTQLEQIVQDRSCPFGQDPTRIRQMNAASRAHEKCGADFVLELRNQAGQ